MGIFRSLLGERGGSSLSSPSKWLQDFFSGSTESKSGSIVNEKTALYSTGVYACVKILAETVAMLPLHTYKRMPGGGKEMAAGHPLYSLLHDIANHEMPSFILREI
ncbi:MAG: phage portal protein, partial [Eubacteriales bacterium]